MDISVKIRALNVAAAELQSHKVSLNSYINSITAIKNNLSMEIKYKARINSDLNTILNVLYAQKRKVNLLSSALEDIASQYVSTERGIVAKYTGEANASSSPYDALGETNVDNQEFNLELINLFWNMTGAAGIAGVGISTLAKIVGADTTAESSIEGLKGVTKVIDKTSSAIVSNTPWYKALFGTNNHTTKGFFANLESKFVGKTTVSTVAKWGGHILTVADSAFENYEESGGKWTDRAIAETTIEAGVDIGLGAILGATAGAVGGAIGAPVIAVGAATAVAVWGVNKAFEAVTGDNVAEWVSDKIIDDVVPAAKKAGKAIKDAVTDGANKVGKSVERAWEGVTSSWGKWVASW